MNTTEFATVWREIKSLHQRLEQLEDAVLSPDDKRDRAQARREMKSGKTTSHDKVVRDLL
jgi:hypothetical protein